MKYILLIHSQEDAWAPAELEVARDESIRLCHLLRDQGQYLGAAPLLPCAETKCVQVRAGRQTVIDGPFAETKEQLAGYFLIDVANMDEAIAIAAKIPGSRRGTTEIRPLVELQGLPAPLLF